MPDRPALLRQLARAAHEATRRGPAARVFGVNETDTEFSRESEDGFGFVWIFHFTFEGPAPNERRGSWEISHCELRSRDGTVTVDVPLKAFTFQALEDIRTDIVESLRIKHQVNGHE